MDERLAWVGFAAFPGIGPGRFSKLQHYFGSARQAWNADVKELQQSGIGNALAESFIDFRKRFSLEAYGLLLQKHNVSCLLLQDDSYPSFLKEIKNPPFVLFVKGNFDFTTFENQRTIGIVGTRNITEYGKQVTEQFTQGLVSAGFVVVSGLALGVDALAHGTTLNCGGRTVAVLGCGVDCCYPRENEKLYRNILEKGGAIVSEYALGVLPSRGSFPSRNRIIAGLSQGVLVTEGAARSGSLITAHDAFATNRPVFAIPGAIHSSLSSGPAKLIQQGAKLVTTPNDIVDALGGAVGVTKRISEPIKGDTPDEQLVLDQLKKGTIHFDDLVRQTEIDSSQLGGVLSLLEMKGVVKRLDAGFFCLVMT